MTACFESVIPTAKENALIRCGKLTKTDTIVFNNATTLNPTSIIVYNNYKN